MPNTEYPKTLTTTDVLRRSVTRVLYCALPYVAFASLYTYFTADSSFFRGFPFWVCVAIIPIAGLLIDLRRLRKPFPHDALHEANPNGG